MWLLARESPSIFFSIGTSYPFLYLVLSTLPWEISRLIFVHFLFFFFFPLIGNHPQQPETMKTHWRFFKQVMTRSIWGCVRQVRWNFLCGQAHVSNSGLRASNQLYRRLTLALRAAVSLAAHNVGWRQLDESSPWKTAHLAYVPEATIWQRYRDLSSRNCCYRHTRETDPKGEI